MRLFLSDIFYWIGNLACKASIKFNSEWFGWIYQKAMSLSGDLEDSSDAAAVKKARKNIASGKEKTIPMSEVNK